MEEKPRPQKILEEISALARVQLRLPNDVQKSLADDPEDVKEDIQELVGNQLTAISAMRVIGAIQNRVGEQVQWPSPLPSEWDELSDILFNTAQDALKKKQGKR